jgi:mRNA-degrading endonuclease RelE of RelBE toxin-antitoxin system
MILILKRAQSFERDSVRLPEQVLALVEKAIRLLAENPRHPSLRTKKMKGTEDIWEIRITRDYRITLQWEADLIILRRVGTHDILRKE